MPRCRTCHVLHPDFTRALACCGYSPTPMTDAALLILENGNRSDYARIREAQEHTDYAISALRVLKIVVTEAAQLEIENYVVDHARAAARLALRLPYFKE